MQLKVESLIKTLTDHYKADEDVYAIWISKEEAEDNLGRDVTSVEWDKILTELAKREAASEMLDNDLMEAIHQVTNGE
jgi:hypothetical protein